MVGTIDESLELQKKIAISIGIFASLASIVNFFAGFLFRGDNLVESFIHPAVLPTLIGGILFLLSGFWIHPFARMFQFISVIVVSAFSMWDGIDSFYGLGFQIIAFVIAYKYGYFDKGFRWKALTWLVLTAVFIEIASRFENTEDQGSSIIVIVFLLFFAGFFYMVYKSDIDRLSTVNEDLASDLIKAKREGYRLEKAKEANDNELSAYREAADKADISIEEKWNSLKNEFQITRKELAVVQIVVQTGSMNSEIADSLGVKESTIKQHIHRVLGKIEARDRADMIVMIRDYLGT